jgi:hypothetical protein
MLVRLLLLLLFDRFCFDDDWLLVSLRLVVVDDGSFEEDDEDVDVGVDDVMLLLLPLPTTVDVDDEDDVALLSFVVSRLSPSPKSLLECLF